VEKDTTKASAGGPDRRSEEVVRDPSRLYSRLSISPLIPVLVSALVLRLLLAALPGFEIDIGFFRSWSEQLGADHPWNFYDAAHVANYTPAYLYVLWGIGELHGVLHFSAGEFEYLLKLPPIATDLASGYLLYRMLEGRRSCVRAAAAAAYLFFPATLFIGAVWGQVDSLVAFLILLSVYFIGRGRPLAGALAFTVGFLVKPLVIAALPFLAIWIMRRHPPGTWLRIAGASTALVLLVILPFFLLRPWEFIEQLREMSNVDESNSYWAYNFWNVFGFFDSGFRGDDAQHFGLANRYWGFLMFAAGAGLTIAATWRSEGMGALALGTALSMFVFYLFVTRMHERYVFPVFLPLLAAAVLTQSRLIFVVYAGLGVVHLANLYWVYYYFNDNELRVDWLYRWFSDGDALGLSAVVGLSLETTQLFSIAMVAALPVLLAAGALLRPRGRVGS